MAKFPNLTDVFKNRILQMDSLQFLILNVNTKDGKVQCIRLYDKNGIKVNMEHHLSHNYHETIPLKNIFDNTYIFSIEESNQILEDHKGDTKNVLKIYYELMNPLATGPQMIIDDEEEDDGGYNGDGGYAGHYVPSSVQKELIPYKIYPESVDINHYDLSISNNKIIEVRNKESGSSIYFEAILIKENQTGKFTGLVSTSVMKVYTALYNKDVINVIHVHLNDTSEEITVDSTFLQRGHSVTDERFFPEDYMGKKLNYKFIFRDYKLLKVYYNVSKQFVDEPDFEEIRIKQDKIVKITNHEKFSNYYGKVYHIPVGMIVRKEKDQSDIVERIKSSEVLQGGICQERHLEELQGLVSVEILFTPETTIMENPIKISMPICKLIPLTPKEELIFEKQVLKGFIRKKSIQIETINVLYENFLSMSKYIDDPELLNTISLDDVKKVLDFVEKEIRKEDILHSLEESDSKEVNTRLTF
jgi:hypothetical protein